MKKISLVFGTRPEAIKLCPVIHALKKDGSMPIHVCVTGQHRQMIDQVLQVFGVKPDVDLALMQPNQTLAGLTSRAIEKLDQYFTEQKPDVVLVQGDTTTVMAAALTAFYHKIKVGHVEAGLRTYNKFAPFPEEINRRVVGPIADYHFAPTEAAAQALRNEKIDPASIYVTGNTVIDALFRVRDEVRQKAPELPAGLAEAIHGKRMILVTGHRRESFGEQFENICRAIRTIVETHKDVVVVYPVHLNPKVQEPVRRLLSGLDRIHLVEPQSYLPFVWLMDHATLVLTDSGGVQEEAPSLGKPVLVMRETTERPEGIAAGNAKLVGTDFEKIVGETAHLLTSPAAYRAMADASNPYGDGKSSARIVEILKR
ncbi:MAG TPA: UDP-N-acetylglucosamine 2-epimerase (non-hydrolyzing) [Planctomycetota bacterium]|nr:UDP-N-acetylglucosamine 2-epimerase (non-hydrolyzing) [Planctomycetota bacterium]